MKAPCRNCEDRHFKCHSDCERYKTYAEEREKLRDERRKVSEEIYQSRRNIERSTRKKGGQR